jgi:hypothetical protein
MSYKGTIHTIVDPATFFGPIVFGSKDHGGGFEPTKSSGMSVVLRCVLDIGLVNGQALALPIGTTASATDGSFDLPDVPEVLDNFVSKVSFQVNVQGRPFYRSAEFARRNLSPAKTYDIFLFPVSQDITAGQVSSGLQGGQLPGNTVLSANPWGLGVAGSKLGENAQFGIELIPDTSTRIGILLDLALHNWDVHVGFPADWCTNADSVFNKIKASLQTDDSQANDFIWGQLRQRLAGKPLNLGSAEVEKLLEAVTIQFTTFTLPQKHTWPASDTSDQTPVVFAQLHAGFPRAF